MSEWQRGHALRVAGCGQTARLLALAPYLFGRPSWSAWQGGAPALPPRSRADMQKGPSIDPVSQQVHYNKTYNQCDISIKRDDASEMFFFQYLRQVPLTESSWSKFTFVRLFLLICTMNCHHHVDRESFTISFYNILPVLQPAMSQFLSVPEVSFIGNQ